MLLSSYSKAQQAVVETSEQFKIVNQIKVIIDNTERVEIVRSPIVLACDVTIRRRGLKCCVT